MKGQAKNRRHSPRSEPKPMHKQWERCEQCGKRTWPDKKAAKAAARQTGGHVDVYPACEGYGHHVGHLHEGIIAGRFTRADWRNSMSSRTRRAG